MGSKTKRLFEHMRSMFEKPSSSTRVSNLLPLGVMEESDTLGSSLHREAIVGNRRALKKILQTSICVDYPNDKGQTPLFCACACDSESTALLLLQHGANPNE
ncbi:unnamed protein product [Lymnaea stagnalis]|uniref:Uncharacterized protein n=1 Tax=Lymnaea stagnalis TaxID=6523 RepID=A0AAV2H8B3_LYMST